MKVVVAVVYYSGLTDLNRCLASLVGQPGVEVEARVVDTSPRQDALAVAHRNGAVHVPAPRNAGYAWALHQGFDSVPDEDFVFVASNSDVVYLPGSLAELSSLAASDNSIVYPLQLESVDGPVAAHNALPSFSRGSVVVQWLGLGRRRECREHAEFVRSMEMESGRFLAFPRRFGGSGAVIAMTAHTWRRVDGLDRRFFLYEEDRALSLTARRLNIVDGLALRARVVHPGGVKSRGLNFQTLDEAMTSQRLLWSREKLGDSWPLVQAQRLGVALRWLRAVLGRRPEERRMYAALHRTLWNRRRITSVPREADGFRRPRNYS